MRAPSGSQHCSMGGLNGTGVKGGVTRRIGAVRAPKPRSATTAAPSAPIPHGRRLVGDDQPSRLRDRAAQRLVVEGRDRAQVEDLDIDPLARQPLGRTERLVDHAGHGDDGHVAARHGLAQHPSKRAMTRRWISFVPSPIWRIFASRKNRETTYSSV
jgi:hypothetical protein